MSRKNIRDGIKTAIELFYSGPVYITRRIDAREIDEYINVFLSSGSAVTDIGVYRQVNARLVITIAKKGATDDDLDTIGDLIDEMIDTINYTSLGAIGAYFTEFSYADDDDEFEKLHLTYDIIY